MIQETQTRPAISSLNSDSADYTDVEQTAFLDFLPARLRGSVTNAFLSGPRRNVIDTGRIVVEVYALFQRKQARAVTPQDAEDYGAVLHALTFHVDIALGFAQRCIAYVAMPEEARQARKQAKAAESVQKWMAGQEPTEKQIACLSRLNYAGPEPTDRAEASRLIDGLLNRKAVTA